jgi:hypothetical protein
MRNDTLADNFKPLLDEITALNGSLVKHPHFGTFRFRFFLSGDWKFLRLVGGMACPNQHDFCLWCTCTKDSIADRLQKWTITRNFAERDKCLAIHDGDPDPPAVPTSYVLPDRTNPEARRKALWNIVYPTHFTILKQVRQTYGLGSSALDNKEANTHNIVDFLMSAEDTMCDKQIQRILHMLKTKQDAHRKELADNIDGYDAARKGYVRPSLFPSIPFDRIILDVLHAFLRIYEYYSRSSWRTPRVSVSL